MPTGEAYSSGRKKIEVVLFKWLNPRLYNFRRNMRIFNALTMQTILVNLKLMNVLIAWNIIEKHFIKLIKN